MSKKNLLLTGSNGFIGKNVIKKLDSFNDFNITKIEKNFYESKNWKKEIDTVIKNTDFILHIGADSNTMNKDVQDVMYHNYYLSKFIFDKGKKYNKSIVFSSSAACNGVNRYPSNLYGWSKYVAEQYGISNNEKFIALRYFNVYGPGEEHKGTMSSVAYQAYKKKTFKLFPNNPKRDFIFIEDIVDATIFPLFNNIESGIYDVGTGKEESFERVLTLMNIEYEYHDESVIPVGYQFKTKADETYFMKDWKPKVSLEAGIKIYLDYLKTGI